MLDHNDSIGYVISTIARKINQYFSMTFQSFDITSEQWSVLHKLADGDGISQRELSERTEKDPNNITKILDQLERKGWATRVSNPQDRRSFLLYISKSGVDLIKQLTPLDDDLIKDLCSSLSPEEVVLLKKMLLQLNIQLNSKLS